MSNKTTIHSEQETRTVTVLYRIYGSIDISVPQKATRTEIEDIWGKLPDKDLIDNLGSDGDDFEITDILEEE